MNYYRYAKMDFKLDKQLEVSRPSTRTLYLKIRNT